MWFINGVISLFVLFGAVASGRWIFRQSWKMGWKFAGCFVLMGLLSGIFNDRTPMVGLYNPLAGVLATWGIMIAAVWGFKKAGNSGGWQSLVVVLTLALLGTIWIPVILNPIGSLPRGSIGGLTSPVSQAQATPTPRAPPSLIPCSAMASSLRVHVARCAAP
jgi:hypothetical protein